MKNRNSFVRPKTSSPYGVCPRCWTRAYESKGKNHRVCRSCSYSSQGGYPASGVTYQSSIPESLSKKSMAIFFGGNSRTATVASSYEKKERPAFFSQPKDAAGSKGSPARPLQSNAAPEQSPKVFSFGILKEAFHQKKDLLKRVKDAASDIAGFTEPQGSVA